MTRIEKIKSKLIRWLISDGDVYIAKGAKLNIDGTFSIECKNIYLDGTLETTLDMDHINRFGPASKHESPSNKVR